ncbi:MAG: hypothetical protein ACI9SP_001853 [Arenicella sp.]|jgi:hypothetical protein
MKNPIIVALTIAFLTSSAFADENHAIHQKGAVISDTDSKTTEAFDILAAHVHSNGNTVTFHMTTRGVAGAEVPLPLGTLAGASAYVYVWPTSMDASTVGFDEGAGILAMVAATHPDFDDTPLFDENSDGNTNNDGGQWHSHWVVLAPTEACGPGALAVKDIPEGTTPNLPVTWPGLPILLDSPGFTPIFDGAEVTLNAAVKGGAKGVSYDGVTAALRVNKNIHSPLFCVIDIFDIASGDLSLPGNVN